MRHITPWLLAALLLLPSPASLAQTTLLAEGFESDFTADGWEMLPPSTGDAWALDSTIVRTGGSSFRIDGPDGYYVSYDLGAAYSDVVFQCWFYDDMAPTKETFVSFSEDPQHVTTTAVHLKVGTSCAYSGDNYSVAEGWHSTGYIVGPARSLGWHQVRIENVGGTNYVFLDGQLLHTTSFQPSLRYLILNDDNHCDDGSSWFDDLLVSHLNPVSTETSSWSLMKSRY